MARLLRGGFATVIGRMMGRLVVAVPLRGLVSRLALGFQNVRISNSGDVQFHRVNIRFDRPIRQIKLWQQLTGNNEDETA